MSKDKNTQKKIEQDEATRPPYDPKGPMPFTDGDVLNFVRKATALGISAKEISEITGLPLDVVLNEVSTSMK
jgi:hypothetical protein